MTGMVEVKFLKSYSASRGPSIYGSKGQVKNVRMSDQLQALLDSGVCELCKAAPAAKREKAVKKKGE